MTSQPSVPEQSNLCRWCGEPEIKHEYTGLYKGVSCYIHKDCTNMRKWLSTGAEAPPDRSPGCLGVEGCLATPICTFRCMLLDKPSECPKCGHVHLGPLQNYERRCTKCDNCWLSILDYPEATGHGIKDYPYLPEPSKVDHPAHYGGDTTYEAIKVIEAWGLGFNLGNVVKYICRSGSKGTRLENLEKAKWYLDREVQKSRDH